MASSGPLIAGTGANDDSVGVLAWDNPSGITTEDSSPSTCSGFSTDTSNYLKATNFGFAIPDATIDGIVIVFNRHGLEGTDSEVKIIKGGTISSTNRSVGAAWADDVFQDDSFGSSSDLWGETWTADDINASTFGAALSANITQFRTLNVDFVEATVHYTEGGVAKVTTKSIAFRQRR
jgi:hypothetical protein